MQIYAERCWQGDASECRKLYVQMLHQFAGSYYRLSAHYGWRRQTLVDALRTGRRLHMRGGVASLDHTSPIAN